MTYTGPQYKKGGLGREKILQSSSHVVHACSDISEEHTASIFRVILWMTWMLKQFRRNQCVHNVRMLNEICFIGQWKGGGRIVLVINQRNEVKNGRSADVQGMLENSIL
jgi:hypothetical protein